MSVFRRGCLWAGPLAPIMFFMVLTLLTLSCSRLLLVGWQWPRVAATQGLWPVLGFGLRFDLIVCCWFVALPVLADLLLPGWPRVQNIWRRVEALWLSLAFGLIVYMEVATPSFIRQYDTRPNQIFFEYLTYPQEVFATLWADYKLPLFLGALLLGVAIRLMWQGCRRLQGQCNLWRWWIGLLALPVVAGLLLLGARSSLDHRPANISTAAFSTDQLVNRLAVNSTYSLIYALSNLANEGHAERLYGHLPRATLLTELHRLMGLPETAFEREDIPTWHAQKPSVALPRRRNIVIILEESLGADFVSALGGQPWTPQLDQLATQGLWFDNLYATGTRSVRGIEAVTTGFLPTPGRSVVKLGLAQQNFFTLASLLKEQGYTNSFIYGGESHFDNMRGFFLGNGFDQVIDQNDYAAPKFRGAWGVSDEDLFARADEEFRRLGDQPFFALVFTSSNHPPFDIPPHVVVGEEHQSPLENAVRYSDYALGRFFEKAKASPYWRNTLFLVVADHADKVSGQALVPISQFQIPALILGADVEPRVYHQLASQSDLPVTLLGLLGQTVWHPMVGRDLLQLPTDDPGRAQMQFGLNHAVMFGDQVVIQQPNHAPLQFHYVDGELQPVSLDPALALSARTLALWPSNAYFNRQYRMP